MRHALVLLVTLSAVYVAGFAGVAVANSGSPVVRTLAQEADAVLGSLSTLSVADRRGVFAAANSEMKAELWKAHLRRFLGEHPTLTGNQKAMILEAMSLATTELFEGPGGREEGPAALRDFAERASLVFPPDLATAAFARLGPEEVPAAQPGSGPTTNLVDDPGPGGGGGTLPTCSCNVWEDYCGLMKRCVGGGCYWRNWGCGNFWTAACTGLCKLYDCGCP